MKIALASDHAGYKLKEIIKAYLKRKKIEFYDFGANSLESVDYPDYARPAAEAVAKGAYDRGIFVCGSGVGVTIVANKVDKIAKTKVDEHLLEVTKSLFAKERIIPFSSESKHNLDVILDEIQKIVSI